MTTKGTHKRPLFWMAALTTSSYSCVSTSSGREGLSPWGGSGKLSGRQPNWADVSELLAPLTAGGALNRVQIPSSVSPCGVCTAQTSPSPRP